MPISKEKLVEYVTTIAHAAGVKMAVGGGVAVAAHGYKRNTADVDAFFHASDRVKVLRKIQESLCDGDVLEELDPAHWILVPAGNSPDERLDLMFATGDPEESAVEMSVLKKYHGVLVPVFPIDLLVATKYLAGREDPKDALDIYALWRRGTYDVPEVQERLRQMGCDEDAQGFADLLTFLGNLPRKKRRRP